MTAELRSAALLLPSFQSGGAERVVINLANGLHALGVSTRIVVLDPSGPMRALLDRAVSVVTLDRPRARTAGPALLAALRSTPVDLLIVSQTHLSLLVCLLRPLLPRRTRLALREPLLDDARPRGLRTAQRVLFPAADVILASSSAMQASLDRLLGGRTPVAALPNPVDVAAIRRDAGVGPDGAAASHDPIRRYVAVSRLIPRKAVDELLDAFATIAGPHDRLDVVGDGPLRGALERHAEALGLADRVRFHGQIDVPASLIARADVLVQPSRSEGMPNAVLEALALGTPVLATDDLVMLEELAAGAAPGVVRVVPRSSLAAALEATPVRTGPIPRPDLLPVAFGRDPVVRLLMGLAGFVPA